jgi:hypothetical protein
MHLLYCPPPGLLFLLTATEVTRRRLFSASKPLVSATNRKRVPNMLAYNGSGRTKSAKISLSKARLDEVIDLMKINLGAEEN